MRNMKSIFGLITLLALMCLAGCGGSGGSGADSPGGSGTAVDPYIEGAVFQEIAADGQTVLQRQSTITNSQGRFVFTKPFTPGSLIVMKPGSTGMHVGEPFQGILKRKVETDDSGELVVSPLTTLLANGMSKADVVSLLGDAGLTGISEADLTTDPMAGLAGQTGTVSDESLYLLHASMAVNATLDILGNYAADYSTLSSSDGALLLQSMAAVAQETLNKSVYVDSLDPDATAPLQLGDVINASVEFSRAVVTQIKTDMANNNGVPNIAMIDDAVLAAPFIHDMVSIHYQDRLGSAPAAGTDPGPVPTPDPIPTPDPVPVDGQAVFSDNCSSCHNVNASGSMMDLSGDSAKIAGRFQPDSVGHMSKTLTADEIQSLMIYVDSIATAPTPPTSPPEPPTSTPEPPVTDPSTPVDGVSLYAVECISCHGKLANTNIVNRDAASIETAIAGNAGGMGGIVLSSEQAQAIADALPVAAPEPPASTPVDGQALYDGNCGSCHVLGNYDVNGSAPQLGGLGNTVISKIERGHMGVSLTADELNALADWADANPAPAPDPLPTPDPVPTPVDGQALYDDNCASCHRLGSYDVSGSKPDLGGLGNKVISMIEGGHKGFSMTADELNALADWADAN